jgi:DNA-binding CsgD family transcriptional regulator
VRLCYPRVTEQALDRSGLIVGREAELGALAGFMESPAEPRTLVLTGGPGIGKTTLWEAALDVGRRHGLRVLSARASGAETTLSSAALIDLLDGVGREELAQLPPPQLRALEVALFRAEPDGVPPEAHAVAVGLLNALRALAAQGPLLVAIDDLQWLDRASGDALAFVARRLDTEPVAFLLARRPGPLSPLERALEAGPLQRLEVGHLSLGATRRLLSTRLGLSLPRNVLRRVFETTLGNALFTVEIGRTLATEGAPAIGEDVPLPDTIEEVLGIRVSALPDPVRRLLLAVALSADLRASQAEEISAPPALDEAVELSVLAVDGERLRPEHPLFATAAKSHAPIREQRELHCVLATLAADEESRATHLALAAERPDEELAAAVAAAAAGAAARGARQDAVVLAEHALRLTPADGGRTERLLALGTYLVAAGEPRRVTDLLSPELDSLPSGTARARALVLLADGVVGSNEEIRRNLDAALAESSGDPALRARVLAEISINDAVIRVERLREAEASALEALTVATGAGPDLELASLYALGWARALRGRAIDDVCERFRAASGEAASVTESPERVAGQRLLWRGDVEQARAVLTRLTEIADERGEAYSYLLQRLHLCQLELRCGNWDAVARLLDEWAESSEQVMWSMYERCRALLAAGRGLPEEAERWVTETLAGAEAAGNRWDRLEALRARGLAALLAGEADRAAESLRAVWGHAQREGVDEPGVFPVAPDLVEALAELGALDEARAVTGRLRELAAEQEHPWALASVARCEALVQLASDTYDPEAAGRLEAAADEYGALGLRFERARSLLSLGRAQRRVRKWAAARASLELSAAAFDELGSPGWAAQARSELGRVGGRRRQGDGDLTPAERRVVELAADGLANKEIAQSLFVTVRTVEVHLKHAYAKLGVRSRAQLSRRLSERA